MEGKKFSSYEEIRNSRKDHRRNRKHDSFWVRSPRRKHPGRKSTTRTSLGTSSPSVKGGKHTPERKEHRVIAEGKNLWNKHLRMGMPTHSILFHEGHKNLSRKKTTASKEEEMKAVYVAGASKTRKDASGRATNRTSNGSRTLNQSANKNAPSGLYQIDVLNQPRDKSRNNNIPQHLGASKCSKSCTHCRNRLEQSSIISKWTSNSKTKQMRERQRDKEKVQTSENRNLLSYNVIRKSRKDHTAKKKHSSSRVKSSRKKHLRRRSSTRTSFHGPNPNLVRENKLIS